MVSGRSRPSQGQNILKTTKEGVPAGTALVGRWEKDVFLSCRGRKRPRRRARRSTRIPCLQDCRRSFRTCSTASARHLIWIATLWREGSTLLCPRSIGKMQCLRTISGRFIGRTVHPRYKAPRHRDNLGLGRFFGLILWFCTRLSLLPRDVGYPY